MDRIFSTTWELQKLTTLVKRIEHKANKDY